MEARWIVAAITASVAPVGVIASICGMTADERQGFLPGTIYLIEFPDGEAVEVHEAFLRALNSN